MVKLNYYAQLWSVMTFNQTALLTKQHQTNCTVQKKNQEKSDDSFKRDLLFENMP